MALLADEKLYSSELLLLGHAAPPVSQAADPAVCGVIHEFLLWASFFLCCLSFSQATPVFQFFPNIFSPSVILPSSCFSFSWDLRGQASHNPRLSKYAQWKLWASEVAAAAALSHESVPAKAAPPLFGLLFHLFPYILSWEFNTLSFPSSAHLIHISEFFGWRRFLFQPPLPRCSLVRPLSLWNLENLEASWYPNCIPQEKHVTVLRENPGLAWATSLAFFPAPFSSPLVIVVPCSPLSFWVGISSSGNASWFADHCWTGLCRDLQAVNTPRNALDVGLGVFVWGFLNP